MEGSNPSCYQTKATRKNVVFCFIQLSFIIIVTDVIYFVIVTGKYDRKATFKFRNHYRYRFSAYLHKLNIYQNNADMVFVVCGSVLGSLLPDIDSTESIISNILPPFTTLISKIINNVFGHRGLLHYSFSGSLWHFLQQITIILHEGCFLVSLDIYFLMPVHIRAYLHSCGSLIEAKHSMCSLKNGKCMLEKDERILFFIFLLH